jgi:N-acetylmuramoyl-L-alanine amidase
MRYAIKNHRLHYDDSQVEYLLTPNRTKNFVLKPEGILVHDTAGRLDGATSVNWFMDPAAQASAHLVVHRDGKITQLAPFNVKTWHAGRSHLNGRSGVNSFAVGIEIVNPGKLTPVGGGKFQAWFGEIYKETDFIITEKTTPEHGTGGWMNYTVEQLDSVEAVSILLFEKYNLQWIWPHWKVSPGRKVDTNPLFPLENLQSKLVGRKADDSNTAIMLANTNQRRWPSYSDNIIQVIPKSKRVELLRSGWYQNGDDFAEWYLVSYKNHEGWVYGSLVHLD